MISMTTHIHQASASTSAHPTKHQWQNCPEKRWTTKKRIRILSAMARHWRKSNEACVCAQKKWVKGREKPRNTKDKSKNRWLVKEQESNSIYFQFSFSFFVCVCARSNVRFLWFGRSCSPCTCFDRREWALDLWKDGQKKRSWNLVVTIELNTKDLHIHACELVNRCFVSVSCPLSL